MRRVTAKELQRSNFMQEDVTDGSATVISPSASIKTQLLKAQYPGPVVAGTLSFNPSVKHNQFFCYHR